MGNKKAGRKQKEGVSGENGGVKMVENGKCGRRDGRRVGAGSWAAWERARGRRGGGRVPCLWWIALEEDK